MIRNLNKADNIKKYMMLLKVNYKKNNSQTLKINL